MKEGKQMKASGYSKGTNYVQGDCINTEFLSLPDAYIKSISVEKWINTGEYYLYVLNVYGRSRFLQCLPDYSKFIKYKAYARYSSLSDLHEIIVEYLKPYNVAAQVKAELPSFPSKKWLSHNDELAMKRVDQLNNYFAELFNKFGLWLEFSELLIDKFVPVRVELNLVGWNKEGINSFLNTLVYIQKFMEIIPEKYDSNGKTLCSLTSLMDYSHAVKELNKTEKILKKGWRSFVPFDYYTGGHLHRIDVRHPHVKEPGQVKFSIQGPTILFIDCSAGGTSSSTIQIIYYIRNHKSDLKNCIIALVNCSSEGADSIRDEVAALLGEDRVIEVDLTNGRNVLKTLDELLKIHYTNRSVVSK